MIHLDPPWKAKRASQRLSFLMADGCGGAPSLRRQRPFDFLTVRRRRRIVVREVEGKGAIRDQPQPRLAAISAVMRPEIVREGRQASFRYGRPKACHQLLVEGDIVFGHEHRPQYFLGADEVVQIGSAPRRTDRAAASGIERLLILRKARVPDVERASARKGLAGPP
jgi:hypothetical protein